MFMKAFLYTLACLALSFFSYVSHASETRIIEAMPSSGKTTAGALAKAKTSGFECFKVKMNPKGNAARVKNTKSVWFDVKSVPETSDAADGALADGKVAVKCQLKAYSNGRFRSADLEESAE